MRKREEVESLAAAVHSFLAFGHLLALVFHVKRKRTTHALIHAAALTYDLYGVKLHLKGVNHETHAQRTKG